MSEREELITVANELGLEFPKNIKTTKLQAMVDEASGVPPSIEDDVPPPGPAVKAEKKGETLSDRADKAKRKKAFVAAQKKKAFATKVITITNKDQRENDVMTTAYLSFENQYFGLSKLVPLDIPVEVEVCLIKVAEGAVITLHKDEIVNGRRTGNKVPTSVKKYAISYTQEQPED